MHPTKQMSPFSIAYFLNGLPPFGLGVACFLAYLGARRDSHRRRPLGWALMANGLVILGVLLALPDSVWLRQHNHFAQLFLPAISLTIGGFALCIGNGELTQVVEALGDRLIVRCLTRFCQNKQPMNTAQMAAPPGAAAAAQLTAMAPTAAARLASTSTMPPVEVLLARRVRR